MKAFVTVSFVAGLVMALASTALAAEPTQGDFDACNRAAQAASSLPWRSSFSALFSVACSALISGPGTDADAAVGP